jgi:hypothetical protein
MLHGKKRLKEQKRDGSSLYCTLDLLLGARVGLEEEQYVETQHRATNGRLKVNRGDATEAC